MSDIVKIEENVADQFNSYLHNQYNKLLCCDYFYKLGNRSIHSFLLSIYNFSLIIRHYTYLLSTVITKTDNDEQIKLLIISLYNYTCLNEKSNIQLFNDYISQLKNVKYKNIDDYCYNLDYYKRVSLLDPYDVACNDLSKFILENSFESCISLLIALETFIGVVNIQLNDYIKLKTNDNVITLLETIYNRRVLMILLNDQLITFDKIKPSIDTVTNIFLTLFVDVQKL